MLTETRAFIIMNSILTAASTTSEIPQSVSGALSPTVGDHHCVRPKGCRTVILFADGVEVYEGMVVGEHSRDNDLDVNCVRRRSLNMRVRVQTMPLSVP
jgi:GTP-binding protein